MPLVISWLTKKIPVEFVVKSAQPTFAVVDSRPAVHLEGTALQKPGIRIQEIDTVGAESAASQDGGGFFKGSAGINEPFRVGDSVLSRAGWRSGEDDLVEGQHFLTHGIQLGWSWVAVLRYTKAFDLALQN